MDTVVRWQAVASTPVRAESPVSAADHFADHHSDLSFLPAGVMLETAGVYLDLAEPHRGPFRALAGQIAGSGNRYVAQRDVSCNLWCRLIKSAAISAFGGLLEVDCDDFSTAGGLLPWPSADTAIPAGTAAP